MEHRALIEADRELGGLLARIPAIHIGGTNGKGSVAYKVAYALAPYYRIGLYTSPHLFDEKERCMVDGVPISQEEYLAHSERIDAIGLPLTYFERWLLISFLSFQEHHVEYAVVEVGMGGRLDATILCSPICSVITSISFDHQEYLGDTLEQIAYEKAGVIKRGIPVVLGPSVTFSNVEAIAQQRQAPVYRVVGQYDDPEQENQAIAWRVLEELPLRYDTTLLWIKPPMRGAFVNRQGERYLFDVAHNVMGLAALKKYFLQHAVLCLGFSNKMYLQSLVDAAATLTRRIHLSPFKHERSAPYSTLQCLHGVKLFPTLDESLRSAQREAHDLIVITGSFFVMEEACELLEIDRKVFFQDLSAARTKILSSSIRN